MATAGRRAAPADLDVGGGWLAFRLTGSLGWVFVALSLALVAYGAMLASAVFTGVWFRAERAEEA